MKLRTLIIMAAATAVSAAEAPAQTVAYSLPSTSFHITVEAICSSYTPGPYAEYAKKYLGIDIPQKAHTSYNLSSIRLTPYLEADKDKCFIINLDGLRNNISSFPFIKFTSQGLIMMSDDQDNIENSWRFSTSSTSDREMLESKATDNLTSTESILYRNDWDNQGGYERIAFKQSHVIEKNTEKKAQEAAAMILELREHRFNIITGNTDATFSGDALRAAIEEIGRIEDRLMSLFIGSATHSTQIMSFDAIPDSSHSKEILIAFRISDTQGLLPADNLSGRPIVMEITPENTSSATEQVIEQTENNYASRFRASKHGSIYYKIPAVCTVKITDGQKVLLQNRIPIYQKGQTQTFPVNLLTK